MPNGGGGGGGGALGGLGGAIGGLIGYALAGQGGKGEFEEIVRLWRAIQDPAFDFRSLTPPQLRVVAELSPEIYEARVPHEVKLAVDSPETRAAQMRSLGYLEQVREEGLPLQDRLRAQELQREVARENRNAQMQVFRNLAERGRLGGGEELAGRMIANQQGAELSRGFGIDLAQMAIKNRLRGAMAAGSLGGQIRGEDIALSSRNADAINRFNEFVATLGTQAARDAALARQQAQGYNVGQRQRVADTNPLLRYETEQANLDRQNRLRQALFSSQLARAGGLEGALGGLGGFKERRRAERIALGQAVGEGVGGAAGLGLDIYGLGGFG